MFDEIYTLTEELKKQDVGIDQLLVISKLGKAIKDVQMALSRTEDGVSWSDYIHAEFVKDVNAFLQSYIDKHKLPLEPVTNVYPALGKSTMRFKKTEKINTHNLATEFNKEIAFVRILEFIGVDTSLKLVSQDVYERFDKLRKSRVDYPACLLPRTLETLQKVETTYMVQAGLKEA